MDNEDYTPDWDKELLEIQKILYAKSPVDRAERIIEFYRRLDNPTPELKEKFGDFLKLNFQVVFQTRAIDKLMDSSDEFDDIIFGQMFPELEESDNPSNESALAMPCLEM